MTVIVMPKVKEITISVGIKPVRDFNSWHIDLGATIELSDEESERWLDIYTEKLAELEERLKQEHQQWCVNGLW